MFEIILDVRDEPHDVQSYNWRCPLCNFETYPNLQESFVYERAHDHMVDGHETKKTHINPVIREKVVREVVFLHATP